MIRRHFIKLATLTGATGLTSFAALNTLEGNRGEPAADATATETVTWRIQGFTCVTCAVGLEVMLRQQRGVVSAKASYPGANIWIQFRPDEVSEASLRAFISETGFTATEQKG